MTNLQKFLRRSTWLTTISLSALCAPLHAQDQTSTQSENPSQAGSEIDPATGETIIVVEGTRASIANSIDAKRSADQIVDVLSADDADRFPDNNLGEALSRIPGISFIRDEDSGDGEFISIRGLDAEFNTVLNNGIRVGSSNTFRRTPLDVATGDGVSSIYVTKAPLPEDASEGIGGVVDIRTRGALERSESFSLRAQLREDTFAADTGFRLSGGFTKHLTDNLGINVSASFRRRFISTFRFDPTGGLNLLNPLTFDGPNGPIVIDDEDQIALVPEDFIGIENFGLEEVGNRFLDVRDQTFNISGTIDWELSDTTKLTFGGSYNRRNRQETDSRLNFDSDDDDFVNGVLTFDDPEIEIDAILDDTIETQQSYFLRGETKTDDWQFNYIVGYSRAAEDSADLGLDFKQDLTDINGDDDLDVTFAPFNAIGFGTFPTANPQNPAVFATVLDPLNCVDEDGDPCYAVDDFDDEFVDETINKVYSGRLDVTRFFDGSVLEYLKAGVVYERSETRNLDVDIAFDEEDLNGITDAGEDGTIGDFGVFTGDVRSFSPIGNPFASVGFNGIPLANRDGLLAIRNALRAGFDPSSTLLPANEIQVIRADEDYYTGYIQAKLNFDDKFTIVGGVRLEEYRGNFATNTSTGADLLFNPDPNGGGATADDEDLLDGATEDFLIADVPLAPSRTSNFEVLPRIVATYNFNDRARLRGAFTTSISRPNFELLAAGLDTEIEIELNDGVDPAAATLADVAAFDATFEAGNPNLRNAYSYNFDLSFEYYFDRQNAISVAGFYKRIDDFIFSSGAVNFFGDDIGIGILDGAGDATQQILDGVQFGPAGQARIDQFGGLEALLGSGVADVNLITPINGDTAEVYGIEFGILHTFTYLPGFLSNMGFIGNLTLQETSAPINLGTLPDDNILVLLGEAQAGDEFIEDFDFFNSPSIVGNAALFYEDRNVEATLSYRYSGTQFESLRPFGLSQYQQGRGFLDFDFEYTFRDLGPLDRMSLTFEVSDILDGGSRFTVNETYGRAGILTDGASFNGRSFRFGVRARF
ncbi:TonB-dependent receptor [Parasphingorhabdus marina DSM 22363]|uniref:TonB-dependent receptor n=1 Tax=Parasphingorhabdus marina DSM 22363 TaxID=1123272 RepID=A0A1N6D1Q8_9SPHN|nr:TonB-dependent receptor [Parasphingorhabdus marina]SIN64752.1 TonB-dependent receptor [Parasphingorhabdus marina DSM 22363]